jgi:hypothetical protein
MAMAFVFENVAVAADAEAAVKMATMEQRAVRRII